MIPQLADLGYPELAPITDGEPRPFWSVVIPVHNRTEFLSQCLQSVCTQLSDCEIIIYDSSERPLSDGKGDQRIKVARGGDEGAIRNWNRAIGLARGHWIHLLHDDDYVKPGFYERLQSGITEGESPGYPVFSHADQAGYKVFRKGTESRPIGAAITGYEVEDQAGNVTFFRSIADERGILPSEDWQRMIGTANYLNPPAVVVKRSTYEQVGLYHPGIPYCADWEFYKRAACFVNWWNESAKLARYRQHDQSGTRTVNLASKYRDVLAAIQMSEKYYPQGIAGDASRAARRFWMRQACADAIGRADVGDAMRAAWILEQATALIRPPALACADCNGLILGADEPRDGWQLEDGRTVCGKCCAEDTKRFATAVKGMNL